MDILGIETSCDETAAAVVADGRVVKSSVVATQMAEHARYGGVVPELASRRHVENLLPVMERALADAQTTLDRIDAIAVTNRPGLLGALLVGVSAAKAIGMARGIPVIPIHHIEAHLYANFLVDGDVDFPAVALVVSGGHTDLFHIVDHGAYRLLGRTRDDAAGEAFDKCARLMGLPYPGGPSVEVAARDGDPKAVPLPRAWMPGTWEFSFSGLKTAVRLALERDPAPSVADVAAGFQAAVVDVLVRKTIAAAKETGSPRILLAGGVAANTALRAAMERAAEREGLACHAPPLALCTDNGAMIAATGYWKLRAGVAPSLDFGAIASEPLAGAQ
ncbi:MAG: tRNA (adenosine(37)-N6)-threonylcarbamoyltransferase complex transferase subunit TsaD [Armatimonadota bacterium]